MSHPGNWHRNPRKMALEMERARRGRPLGVSMLRPFDTMQLGWRAEASCDLCQFSRHFRAPADLQKTHWWYVIEATRCPVHMRPFDSIALYSGDRCFMGSVVRLG